MTPAVSTSPRALVNRIDQVKAFMLFSYFGGDTHKTASALSCDESSIVSLSHDFRWLDRCKGQNRLDTDDGRKLEQEINRARNYTLAQRLGLLLEHITMAAARDPEAWAETNCIDVNEDGEKTFSSKPLLEIAKAAQVIQDMTYRSLGDKIATTASTTEASDGKVTNLMTNVYLNLGKLEETAKRVAKRVDPDHVAVLDAVTNAQK